MVCSSDQLPAFFLTQHIKPHCQDDDESLDDELIKCWYFQQAHAIIQDADNESANNSANDRTDATRKTRSADNNR